MQNPKMPNQHITGVQQDWLRVSRRSPGQAVNARHKLNRSILECDKNQPEADHQLVRLANRDSGISSYTGRR